MPYNGPTDFKCATQTMNLLITGGGLRPVKVHGRSLVKFTEAKNNYN